MLEVIQILVMTVTIGFFVWWVMTLKKGLVEVRREVAELKRIAAEKAQQEAAQKETRVARGPDAPSKLWTVGNAK